MITADIVLILPPPLRELAVAISNLLADAMSEIGGAAFRLGEQFPGRFDGPCEPHISLFMMAIDDSEVPEVAAAVADAARTVAPVMASAIEYRHNHEGAPEVFFAKADDFRAVQHAVVTAAEPLRRGRIRELDPGGKPLAAILDDPDPDDPARVRQLRTYGFDDVSDEQDDRFNPHVTLTWPVDETSRVDLSALRPPQDFSGRLTDIALYGMAPNGTCTQRYGSWTLTGSSS
ncbi:hypothetical protein [Mycolicibacterium sp. 018/SC-01/001]|uniref:hypothetical protein n=1 Tax=Mycolicibacterium sp. 018/SC-01/001 TaxID=2592069 RepID=UPI00163DBA7F|nr:hypothetical protein [Mycolicibacterium sp. 018/SC-01/001]